MSATLINFLSMLFPQYMKNFGFMRTAVIKVGKEFEQKSYQELLRPAEELSITRLVDGEKLTFSAESVKVEKNGDLHFCIDANGLSTLFGIKPSYQFIKRKDGSIYY